jgi:hypothetical protein
VKAAAKTRSDDMLVVYGIVAASVDKAVLPDGVVLVTEGPVAAVVAAGNSPTGPAGQVRRHDAMVSALVANGVTVLPMRFGTAVEDPARLVADVLTPHGEQFNAALERLDGFVQYTVRVSYVEDAVVAAVLRDDPRLTSLRDAVRRRQDRRDLRISLGQAVSEAIERRRPGDVERIGAMLAPIAAEVVTRPAEQSDRLGDYACLVPRARGDAFETEVERVAARHHEAVRMTLLGPLAPYEFVPGF